MPRTMLWTDHLQVWGGFALVIVGAAALIWPTLDPTSTRLAVLAIAVGLLAELVTVMRVRRRARSRWQDTRSDRRR
jgi:hypothetical protein